MDIWLLLAPQARCGMSHVAPGGSLLVLLRSLNPWLKSTKYSPIKKAANHNVGPDISMVNEYTCSKKRAYNCSLWVWWCYRSVRRRTALKDQKSCMAALPHWSAARAYPQATAKNHTAKSSHSCLSRLSALIFCSVTNLPLSWPLSQNDFEAKCISMRLSGCEKNVLTRRLTYHGRMGMQ
jgi:hypothetical protein